jgi:hypothetical protein
MRSAEKVLVYSYVDLWGLIFLPEVRAESLARTYRALRTAKTWGAFRHGLPAEVWKEVKTMMRGAESKIPADRAVFNADAVSGRPCRSPGVTATKEA